MDTEKITATPPARSLARMIAGQLAVVAIPVFGWLTSGYDIVPDIGRLSSGEVFVICLYAAAFGVAAIYAAIATASCFRALYRFHSQGKNSKLAWLLLLPFPGCLFIPVILLRIAFTSRRSVKWIACGYTILSILSASALVFFYFEGIKWVPTIAVFMLPVLYIFMLAILYLLADKPAFTRGEKIAIILFLCMFIGPLAYTGCFLYSLKTRMISGRERLEEIYQRPLTGAALRDLYYHGEKPNLHRFATIFTPDEKMGDIDCKVSLPENLEPFYRPSLTTQKQRRDVAAWLQENQSALTELDRLLEKEKYFKTPESFRNYDGLLYGLLLPEVKHFRDIPRICLLRVRDAVDRNDIETALTAYRSSRRIMEYQLDDHFLISLLIGVATEGIRLNQLQIMIGSQLLSNDQIKQIIAQLKQDVKSWSKPYKNALYGNTVASLNAILFNSRPVNEYTLFETGYFSKETDSRWLEDEFFDFNDYLLQFFLAPVQTIYYEDLLFSINAFILQASEQDLTEYQKVYKNIPQKFFLSRFILLSMVRIPEKMKEIRSRQQAAIIALRIELYRRQNGRLPESLNDLAPEFIDEVYLDPFTGKPLRYLKGDYQVIVNDYRNGLSPNPETELIKAHGYRVYSIGPDQCDDNGLHGTLKKKQYDDSSFSVTIK
jgi:hypothetical protein